MRPIRTFSQIAGVLGSIALLAAFGCGSDSTPTTTGPTAAVVRVDPAAMTDIDDLEEYLEESLAPLRTPRLVVTLVDEDEFDEEVGFLTQPATGSKVVGANSILYLIDINEEETLQDLFEAIQQSPKPKLLVVIDINLEDDLSY